MIKKLCIFLAVAAMANIAFAAEDDPCGKWPDLKTEKNFGVVYYQIGTAADLYKFACMVNTAEENTVLNGMLTADICVNSCEEGDEPLLNRVAALDKYDKLKSDSFEPWTPIGTDRNRYVGIFEGKKHTVSGLFFNDDERNLVGLFGAVGANMKKDTVGVVRNVGVVDSYFKGARYVGGVVGLNEGGEIRGVSNEATVIGMQFVGGIVGENYLTSMHREKPFDYSYGYVHDVSNTGVVSGDTAVGGIVGQNSENCRVRDAHNAGDVSGEGWLGGVVGNNYGSVSNVYNTGTVSGEGWLGGVVGNNYGSISKVYNTGSVSGVAHVGGVVGYNSKEVSDVYNMGTVSGTDHSIGGVVGKNEEGSVSNVYNSGLVLGDGSSDNVGGVAGRNFNGSISNAYYNVDYYTGDAVGTGMDYMGPVDATKEHVENVEGKTTAGLANGELLEGFSSEIWVKGFVSVDDKGSVTLHLPYLIGLDNQPTFKIEADEDKYLEIATAQELKMFAQIVNNGVRGEEELMAVNAKLTADICLNACGEGESLLNADGTFDMDAYKAAHHDSVPEQWTPIGSMEIPYKGKFDGQKHTVRGLFLDDDTLSLAGLFGQIDYPGTYKSSDGWSVVQNLGVVDSHVRGCSAVGAVAGKNNGNIRNVYNTGVVSGIDAVGGVVGVNNGYVSDAYNTGSVSGNDEIGGVVGDNGFILLWGEGDSEIIYAVVTKVYNTGIVSATSIQIGGIVARNDGVISIAYNAGEVKGSSTVGGVVGYNSKSASVSDAYNAAAVIANSISGGIAGENKGSISNVYNTGVDGERLSLGDIVGWTIKEGSISNAYVNADFFNYDDINPQGVGKTTAELANGKLPEGFSSEIWGAGSADESVSPARLKTPYLKAFGEASRPSFLDFGPVIAAENGAYASVDGSSDKPLNVTKDFVVTGPIAIRRWPNCNGYITLMLPFAPVMTADRDTVKNLHFHEFAAYTDGVVQTIPVSQKKLQANTPYVVSTTGNLVSIIFRKGGTINTQKGGAYDPETGLYKKTLENGWSIYGTYKYKTWEEGDEGLGRTYGFAGLEGNDRSISGQFAKVAAGAYIYPTRAYLEYDKPSTAGRPAVLPEIIKVVSVENAKIADEAAGSKNGASQTTRVIGTLDTRTGEFKFANDRWFDLQGRYLGVKKPTQKGAYYNNGKKVIVK